MIKYFLGANTGNGFYSLFDELYFENREGRLFVIKGGPGTGKSSVMKAVASQAESRGYTVERICCSSDPDSLDAVIIPEIKTSIADGTSPHVIEPEYPGAVEQIVNLGECWDAGYLWNNAERIKEKTFECSSYHKRSVRFLKAYSSMLNDSRRIVSGCVDKEKLENYCERLFFQEIKGKNGQGKMKKRFLSAVTPEGITCFDETVSTLCDKTVCIDDEYGVIADYIVSFIAKKAVKSGFDIIVCPCVTDPKKRLEHLIIPEKGFCLFTNNDAHFLSENVYKTVSAKRFLNTSEMKKHSARLSFNKRVASELLDEAVFSLLNAKSIHDELESYYTNAMDFDLVSEKTQALIKEIFD